MPSPHLPRGRPAQPRGRATRWAPGTAVPGRRVPLPAQGQAGQREAAGAQGNSPSAARPNHIPRRRAGSRRQPQLEQGTQWVQALPPSPSALTQFAPSARRSCRGAGDPLLEIKSARSLNPRRPQRGGQRALRVTWLALSRARWLRSGGDRSPQHTGCGGGPARPQHLGASQHVSRGREPLIQRGPQELLGKRCRVFCQGRARTTPAPRMGTWAAVPLSCFPLFKAEKGR